MVITITSDDYVRLDDDDDIDRFSKRLFAIFWRCLFDFFSCGKKQSKWEKKCRTNETLDSLHWRNREKRNSTLLKGSVVNLFFWEFFAFQNVIFFQNDSYHLEMKETNQSNNPKSKISYFCDPMKGFFNCKYNSTSNICNIHFQTFWTARFACAGAGTVSLSNNILGDSICFRQTCLKVVNGHLVIK